MRARKKENGRTEERAFSCLHPSKPSPPTPPPTVSSIVSKRVRYSCVWCLCLGVAGMDEGARHDDKRQNRERRESNESHQTQAATDGGGPILRES